MELGNKNTNHLQYILFYIDTRSGFIWFVEYTDKNQKPTTLNFLVEKGRAFAS